LIEIIARDRAGAYSEAVDIALPAAKQVSDRWRLLSNLRDNVERLLYRLGPQLRQAAQQVNVSKVTLGRQGILSRNSQRSWERLGDQRRATRLALYKQVMALRAQGGSMKGIGRELSIDQRTVRRFVTGGKLFPERAHKARGPTPLDPYRDDIEERIVQGCRFPELIWQELKQRGYLGSRGSVQNCVTRLLFPLGKTPLVLEPVQTMPIPSAGRVFGWFLGRRNLAIEEPRSADHERFVQALCKIEPVVGEVRSLAREFLGLMHRRSVRHFDRWLKRLSYCDAVEMRRFAQSLCADLPAVRAAFKLQRSNGQTEGHDNRLKLLKRQMYARANIDLLRLRVLKPN
jgi:hypothetical protein